MSACKSLTGHDHTPFPSRPVTAALDALVSRPCAFVQTQDPQDLNQILGPGQSHRNRAGGCAAIESANEPALLSLLSLLVADPNPRGVRNESAGFFFVPDLQFAILALLTLIRKFSVCGCGCWLLNCRLPVSRSDMSKSITKRMTVEINGRHGELSFP